MRIIGGRLGGRRFDGPATDATRPTSDRVREGIASALASRDAFDGARVLDLFAGTGGWAFEALSRGATQAVLVDRDRRACQRIKDNAALLGLDREVTVVQCDLLRDATLVLKHLRTDATFDLVFVDPPYAELGKLPALLTTLIEANLLTDDCLCVIERASRDPAVSLHLLAEEASYRYGDTAVDLARVRRGGPTT